MKSRIAIKLYVFAVSLLPLPGLVACGLQSEQGSDELNETLNSANAASVSVAASPLAAKLWNAYVREVYQESPELQQGCEPRIEKHAPATEYRGSVMLLHGFSPCPQQYFALAKRLTAEGYDVFLPLLPGHGRAVLSNNRDDFSKLPTLADWNRYEKFALQMNSIMAELPGQKVIGGLSVGGAIAARAAELALPAVYQRALLLSPYFGHAKPEVRLTLAGLRNSWKVPALRPLVQKAGEAYTGWGIDCVNERGLGRAGYCDFALKNGLAIEEFGTLAHENVREIVVPAQIVRIEGDKGASFEMMGQAAKTLKQNGSLAGDVIYPRDSGVNHSLLSRFDSPAEDKYWIDSLEKALVRFIVDGIPVTLGNLEVRHTR